MVQKKWHKPQLKVLARSHPEEVLWGACKHHGAFLDGPRGWAQCENWTGYICHTNAGS